MANISKEDVGLLREILGRLKEFHKEWSEREDDPEDMWSEAPEMVVHLIAKMEPIMNRIDPA